jgi:GT2 family glycosyltransferase
MTEDRARVLIVIVNYRTGALVVDCLRSLAPEITAQPTTRVVVVDNASGDGSAAAIADAIASSGWSAWARLVASPINGGFAYGCNFGIRSGLESGVAPDLVWLLNPDTRVLPGALAALSGFFASHPQAGIAGSAIRLADGSAWPFAFRFPSILGEIERGVRLSLVSRLLANHCLLRRMGDQQEPVASVSGCSMMIRWQVFEAIGLLDENYFLYFEETDFCLAAARAGWPSWYVPDASIVHIAGQSTGVNESQASNRRRPRYWFDSRRRYFIKNHGRAYAMLADTAWLVSHMLWTVRRVLQARPDPDPPHFTKDFIKASSAFATTAPSTRQPCLQSLSVAE